VPISAISTIKEILFNWQLRLQISLWTQCNPCTSTEHNMGNPGCSMQNHYLGPLFALSPLTCYSPAFQNIERPQILCRKYFGSSVCLVHLGTRLLHQLYWTLEQILVNGDSVIAISSQLIQKK
jgi:hypothetical protein